MAEHKSVLLEECIQYLQINPRGVYVDGTVGLGGHSQEIARRLEEGGRLIAIDRDETASPVPGTAGPLAGTDYLCPRKLPGAGRNFGRPGCETGRRDAV